MRKSKAKNKKYSFDDFINKIKVPPYKKKLGHGKAIIKI